MNAPELASIHRAAIDGAQYLPLNLCKPAGLNHRKRFNAAALAELADSIENVGVMQPVIARPIAGAKRGGALYEVIVGERRLRACELVAKKRKEHDIAVIPAIVRELSNFEARELATTENLQREDVHPLEEAEGYEDLLLRPIAGGEFHPPRAQGYNVEQLAARIGKSTGYVFKRLKLLALIPAAREAFFDDKITNSVAVLIARMPASVQPEATKKVLQGWAGDPLPFRQARELLEREFMLKLSSAPFKITDETLVPGAGNCKECPKRTGAAPDLFDDIKSADVCTDPACFAAKKDAHQARIVEQARAEGREVITGAAAKKVKPHQHSSELKGYTVLDKIEYSLPGGKTMKQHLGKDAPPIALLEDPNTHDLVPVVRTEDAMKVLRDKGVIKGSKLSSRSDNERKAEAKAKAETAWRNEVARRVVAECVKDEYDDMDLHSWLLPEVALAMWTRLDHDTTVRAAKLLGWDNDVEQHIRGLNAKGLDQALIAMAIAGQLYVNQFSGAGSKPTRLLQIAGRLGIDGARVRAELDAAAKAKVKVKKPAAKKAAGGLVKALNVKARAVKYRYALTGETWSGRGLQPAWLKAALASGRKLEEFATGAVSSPDSKGVTNNSGNGVEPESQPAIAAQPEPSAETKPAAAKAAGKQAKPGVMLSDRAAWPFPDEAAS